MASMISLGTFLHVPSEKSNSYVFRVGKSPFLFFLRIERLSLSRMLEATMVSIVGLEREHRLSFHNNCPKSRFLRSYAVSSTSSSSIFFILILFTTGPSLSGILGESKSENFASSSENLASRSENLASSVTFGSMGIFRSMDRGFFSFCFRLELVFFFLIEEDLVFPIAFFFFGFASFENLEATVLLNASISFFCMCGGAKKKIHCTKKHWLFFSIFISKRTKQKKVQDGRNVLRRKKKGGQMIGISVEDATSSFIDAAMSESNSGSVMSSSSSASG